MVQVDVFWSYGLGAGFAMTAARQLRARHQLRREAAADAALALKSGQPAAAEGGPDELRAALAGEPPPPPVDSRWADFKDLLQNRYMVVNILYAALLFAPSGIYLLWGFPNWETMQAGSFSMPAWLIVSFAITNTTQAILGFWVTERLIVSGRQYLAALQAWIGYFGMFFILVHGWDSFGWHRFFSEDRAAFLAWDQAPAIENVTSWLTSSVALTLYGMGLILIPLMIAIMVGNYRGGLALGGAFSPNRPAVAMPLMVAAYAAFLLSGVPLAIVSHLIIDQLGWILGAAVSAALIYLTCLSPRTGLFHHFYRYIAPEDAAYEKLRAERGMTGDPPHVAASRA